MAILSTLKNTFLPTSDVARDRRVKSFGTDNKFVAATTIGVLAAGAIAAPGFIAGGGIKKLGQAYAGSKLSTKAGLFLAAPIIAGRIASDPKNITKAPAAVVNLQKNVYETAKDPSKENLKKLVEENPVLSTGLALVAGYAVGKTGVNAYNAFQNSQTADKIEKNTEALLDVIKSNDKQENTNPAPNKLLSELPNPQTSSNPQPMSSALPATPIAATSTNAGSVEPITRETQILGREPRSRRIAKRKSKTIQPIRNSVRVNIINQNINKLRRT